MERPKAPSRLVPCICAKCGKPIRIYGGWYMGEAEWDGSKWRAPIARMWGGNYTHGDCKRDA